MSRWITTFVATSLVFLSHQQLWSWGHPKVPTGAPVNTEVTPLKTASFPLNAHQDWFVTESYLLWSPHEDDIDWAYRFSTTISSEVDVKVQLKKPDFGWYSGVRLAVGRYLPNHDHWDISLISTYFYADSKNHTSPDQASGGSLISAWSPIAFTTNYNEGKSVWRLNFFTWDLALGRNLFLSSKMTAHPFFTLRNFLIYEEQTAHYSGAQNTVNPIQNRQVSAQFHGHNNSWGIGPRIGSDFTFYINKFWTLLGSLSGSVLFGNYNVGETVRARLVDNFLLDDTNYSYRVSDREFAIRSNLEGSIGMGWEKWVNRNRVRIAPSVVFEAAQWFDVNQWITVRNPITSAPITVDVYHTDRLHGDLTFLGFTFNLQVDF